MFFIQLHSYIFNFAGYCSMNNFHDKTAASQLLEHNSNLNNDISSFHYGTEKDKTVKEQAPELLNNDVHMSTSTPITNKPEEQNSIKTEIDNKPIKKTKRRKYQNSKQMKKCKTEKNGTEEKRTEKDHGDEHVVSLYMQPVSRGESFLNNSNLDEILSEKKTNFTGITRDDRVFKKSNKILISESYEFENITTQ